MSGDTVIADQGPSVDDLLSMIPAKDADHATWRAYHMALFEAGKLEPLEPTKK
jgi:hypothetical protein